MKKLLLSLMCILSIGICAKADGTWKRVTSTDDLTAGDSYVMVCESNNAIMGNISGKYFTSVEINTLNNGVTPTIPADALVLTVESDGSSYYWSVKETENYLTCSAAKSMALGKKGTTAATTVTFSGNNATISYGSNGTIRYNSQSPRFLTYASGQTAIQLYKLSEEGGSEDKTPVTLAWSEATATATVGEAFTAPTLSAEPASILNEVFYSSSNKEVATVDAISGEVTLVGAGETKITAAFTGDATYKSATAEYVLTVKAAEGGEEPADGAWVRINSTDDLTVGARYIVVYEDGKVAMSTSQNSNNIKPVDVTISNGTIATLPATAMTLVLEEENNKYYWYAENATTAGYLQSANGGSNYLKIATKGSNYTATTVSFSGNDAIVTFPDAVNGTKVRNLQYNASNKIFATYTGTQKNIQLYKEAGEVVVKTPVKLGWSAEAIELTEGEELTAPTLTVDPAEAAAAVEFSTSNEAVATVDAQGNITLAGATGTATITAAIKGNETYANASAAVTITVKKAASTANSIAEAMTMEADQEFTVNFDLTVGYGYGTDIYATDGTDWILIYKAKSTIGNNVKPGNVIPAGWKSTYTLYNNLKPEIMPVASTLEATEGEDLTLAEPAELTTDMINHVVVLKGVTVSAETPATVANYDILFNDATINARNKFLLESYPAGNYDITCVIDVYSGKVQVYPIEMVNLGGTVQIVPSYKFAASELTAYLEDETIALPALNGVPEGLEITYTSSDENIAAIIDGEIMFGEAGTVTITAANEETEEYAAYSTSFTLNILAEKPIQATFDFTTENAYGMTVQSGNSQKYEEDVKSITENNTTISFDGKYRAWLTGGKYELRINKESSFTVTSDYNYLITNIAFEGSDIAFKTSCGNLSGKTWTPENGATGNQSVTFTTTATRKINTITVTLIERNAPEFAAEFGHSIYTDESGRDFNTFNVEMILSDNNVGADHYTLSYNGKLIDNNVELDNMGDAMINIEYLPYEAAYDFAFTAVDAQGAAIDSYMIPVTHAFDLANATPIELETMLGHYGDPVEGTDMELSLNVAYGVDVPADYVYYLGNTDDNADIHWVGDNLIVDNYATAPYNNGKFDFSAVEFPEVSVNAYAVFPVAHKEIVVIEENAAAPPRKVASRNEIVTVEHQSNTVAATHQADENSTTTGVEGIAADNAPANAPVEFFNINGVSVNADNLTPGLYIRRQGTKVEKVIVK